MGAANGRRFTVTKSQIYFLDPNGMQIGWQERRRAQRRTDVPASSTDSAGPLQFQPGLHLSAENHQYPRPAGDGSVSDDRGRPDDPATMLISAHNAIPVQFTTEDFDR